MFFGDRRQTPATQNLFIKGCCAPFFGLFLWVGLWVGAGCRCAAWASTWMGRLSAPALIPHQVAQVRTIDVLPDQQTSILSMWCFLVRPLLCFLILRCSQMIFLGSDLRSHVPSLGVSCYLHPFFELCAFLSFMSMPVLLTGFAKAHGARTGPVPRIRNCSFLDSDLRRLGRALLTQLGWLSDLCL